MNSLYPGAITEDMYPAIVSWVEVGSGMRIIREEIFNGSDLHYMKPQFSSIVEYRIHFNTGETYYSEDNFT